MEIERKYLIPKLPDDLSSYPHKCIQQGYICTDPVVRIRKSDDKYILTYKGKGLLSREEYNLPLTKEGYEHMLPKVDGRLISKTRYLIPYDKNHTIELDVFEGDLDFLWMAEVEFESEEDSNSFTPPEWFGKEVTFDKQYHNSNMVFNLPKQD